MTIAPLEKIYWSDIEEACLTFIKTKCCNIDEMSSTMDEDFIYGNSLSYTGYTDATTVMPYHDVTVTFTNNDTVCQVVTSETVRQQLRSFIDIHLGSLGSLGFINVSTYASILNLYTYIAGFISAKLLLIRHPFKSSDGYVFYDSNHMAGANYGQVRVSSQLSSSDMLTYLTDTFNNSSYGDATGAQGSGRIPARAMLLTMSNECVTTGYPSGYAAYESSTPGTYTFNVAQSGVYDVHLVGGGGGGSEGASDISGAWYIFAGAGGSGAHVWWWQYLDAGSYSVTVGDKGARVSGGYGSRTGGTGGNTVFLSQTAGGGLGGYSSGGAGGGSSSGGEGGSYTTSYNGTAGNKGNSGIWSQTGGASVYTGYGKGGDSGADNAGTGAIVLFYKSALAPIIFESSSTGSYTINITEEEEYEITIVGGGGGGSNNFGGAGAGIRFRARLSVGSYTGSIGNGGAGAPAYVRNNDGQTGGATTFNGQDISITCNGGIRRQGRRHGGGGGNTGTLVYNIGITYNILARTSDGVETPYGLLGSNYSAKGSGGQPQGSDTGAGYAGQSGYVCVRKLAGK